MNKNQEVQLQRGYILNPHVMNGRRKLSIRRCTQGSVIGTITEGVPQGSKGIVNGDVLTFIEGKAKKLGLKVSPNFDGSVFELV